MNRYFEETQVFAKALDAKDELAQYRERFYQVEGHIYMDGNSLGLCSKDAEEAVLNMLRVWKENGIFLWNIEEGRYYQ